MQTSLVSRVLSINLDYNNVPVINDIGNNDEHQNANYVFKNKQITSE